MFDRLVAIRNELSAGNTQSWDTIALLIKDSYELYSNPQIQQSDLALVLDDILPMFLKLWAKVIIVDPERRN
jgi:hypothetical protein